MDTSIIQTPLYYGQFVWSQKCQNSYIPYLYNTDTSVKWTLGSVSLVSALKRFDCMPLGWKNSKIHCFACWGASMSLYVFYYCISYCCCYCPSFNLSLWCLSPSVCLVCCCFKAIIYVACWNFTLTWPRQCQALCSQWLALLNYIMYLCCCCCFEGICTSFGSFWWDSVQFAQGEMEACLPLQVWYKRQCKYVLKTM